MIRKIFFLLSAFALLFAQSGCELLCEEASGQIETDVWFPEAFTRIEAGNSAEIMLHPGDTLMVEVRTDDNVLENLKTNVRGGKLEIYLDRCIRNITELRLDITLPRLEGLTIKGAASVYNEELFAVGELDIALQGSGDADLLLNAEEIHVSLKGSGNARLHGITNELEADIRDAGNLSALQLKARDVELDVSGSGDSEVYASRKIDVHVSGSGSVRYHGHPQDVKTKRVGAGRISRMDKEEAH